MISCQRLAFVALSARPSVAISHNMQLSMLTRNLCWVVWRLAALALALALVNNHNSLTNCILILSGKTIATEEYSHSSLFCDVARLALSTSMCRALTLVLLLVSHLTTPSLIALYHTATWTPVVSQIRTLRASLSNLSAKNKSHPSQVVSSTCWSCAFHMPCSVDLSHHPMFSIILSGGTINPKNTWG